MKWRIGLSLLGLLALSTPPAMAADHQDGTAVTADPTSDINDVYAWMSTDATKVNLVMTLYPAAPAAAAFSNTVQYVFHTTSKALPYTGAAVAPQKDLICQFDTSQNIQCWLTTPGAAAADDYISATAAAAGATAGATSKNGDFTLFAGRRADPFFFNLDAFKAVAAYVTANLATLSPLLNNQDCPVFSTAAQKMISANIVSQLSHAPAANGGAFPGTGTPVDHFLGFDALAIVVQVNKSALAKNGPLLSVWGATYKRTQ